MEIVEGVICQCYAQPDRGSTNNSVPTPPGRKIPSSALTAVRAFSSRSRRWTWKESSSAPEHVDEPAQAEKDDAKSEIRGILISLKRR